ncbi:hypothetical protein ACO0R3_000239 [Hanseniaspora guilliermondii]
MNDPRFDLYSKENDLSFASNEAINDALEEIEKHKREIAKLEELIEKWRDEISRKAKVQDTRAETSNILFKKLLDSEKPKLQKKPPIVTNNNFMLRKVHSFYNDRLFKGSSDNRLEFQTEEVMETCEYSNTNLSLRYIPLEIVETVLSDYRVINFAKLFKLVRPPNYEFSNDLRVDNFCVVGIVHEILPIKFKQKEFFERSKIDIDSNKIKKASTEVCSKNFSVVLTDLKHTLLLTIHGNKLIKEYYTSIKAGDVIMIEAPNVYKSSRGFALSIDEAGGLNQIMEIGKCANYSQCGMKLKDGKKCSGFYDNRNHKSCEYHEEIDLDVKLSRRMELNSGYLGRRIGPQEKMKNTHTIGKVDLKFKNQRSFNRFHNSIEYDDGKDMKINKQEQKKIEKSKKDNLRLLRKLQMKSASTNTNTIKESVISNKQKNDKKKNELLLLLQKDLINKHK